MKKTILAIILIFLCGLCLYFTTILNLLYAINQAEDKLVIVVGNNVNIRVAPDKKSDSLYQLENGSFVYPLKSSTKIIKINGIEGKWIFVKTDFTKPNSNERIKGWIFDNYLGYKKKFKIIKSWDIPYIKGIGHVDESFDLFCKNDGSFIMQEASFDKNGYIESPCKVVNNKFTKDCSYIYKGHLYKFKNIIWAKIPSLENGGDYYLIFKNNEWSFLCDY